MRRGRTMCGRKTENERKSEKAMIMMYITWHVMPRLHIHTRNRYTASSYVYAFVQSRSYIYLLLRLRIV
jgi:hypothetical protein